MSLALARRRYLVLLRSVPHGATEPGALLDEVCGRGAHGRLAVRERADGRLRGLVIGVTAGTNLHKARQEHGEMSRYRDKIQGN
jgi:hypothetical protein